MTLASNQQNGRAYIASSRTNISFLGSFIRLSQSQRIRNATLEGFCDSSVAGRERVCFRWSEKSISRPPLEGVVSLMVGVESEGEGGRACVNSTVSGILSAIVVDRASAGL